MLNTRNHVWPHFQTPQSLSKTLHYESYFQLSSLCLEMWSNTVFHAIYCIFIFLFVYLFTYLFSHLSHPRKGLRGCSQHFSKGGVTLCQTWGTHQIVMSFWPPVVGCLLAKGLQKGGHRDPGHPPPQATLVGLSSLCSLNTCLRCSL